MKTIADAMTTLGKKKAKYEKYSKGTPRDKQTVAHMIGRLNQMEDELFEYQQSVNGGETAEGSVVKAGKGVNVLDQFKDTRFGGSKIPEYNSLVATNPNSTFSPPSPANSVAKGFDFVGAGQTAMNFLPTAANWLQGRSAINKLKAPDAPILTPNVKLNKTLDVSSQINASNRAKLGADAFADRNFSDNQTSMALRQQSKVDNINRQGELFNAQTNYRTQVGNQESMMNAEITNRNVNAGNNYRDSLTDFRNNRTLALSNNNTMAMDSVQLGMRDLKEDNMDVLKYSLDALKREGVVNDDIINVLMNFKGNPAVRKLLKQKGKI